MVIGKTPLRHVRALRTRIYTALWSGGDDWGYVSFPTTMCHVAMKATQEGYNMMKYGVMPLK